MAFLVSRSDLFDHESMSNILFDAQALKNQGPFATSASSYNNKFRGNKLQVFRY